jgi:hypothetical protein
MSTTTEKQTAVEWLVKQLNSGKELTTFIYHAKEMEKQQIIEAHAVGRIKECSGINTDGEEYYKETFNK